MSNNNEFHAFARNYREIHDENLKKTGYTSSYFAERKIREIVSWLKGFADRNYEFLDMGCGDGLCSEFFRSNFPNSRIYGLDPSIESIRVANQKNIPNAFFKTYDGKSIPHNDETFDVILLADVIHHVPESRDRLNVLGECKRTLKKEGKLFVFEHNPSNPVTRAIVKDCEFDKDAVLLKHGELMKLMEELGFTVKCRFIIFLPGCLKVMESIERLFSWLPLGAKYYVVGKVDSGE